MRGLGIRSFNPIEKCDHSLFLPDPVLTCTLSFAPAVQEGLSACPAGLHTYDIIVCAYPLRGYPKNLIMDNKTPVRIFEGCGVFNQLYDVDKVKDKTTS